jgi:hypothetical protein
MKKNTKEKKKKHSPIPVTHFPQHLVKCKERISVSGVENYTHPIDRTLPILPQMQIDAVEDHANFSKQFRLAGNHMSPSSPGSV